jgi:hypothetical protein
MELTKLDFPEQNIRLRENKETLSIYDHLRKKWLICTPEEWVRQNLILFLITNMNYPRNLIAIEKQICIAGRKLRFDGVIYDKDFKPLVIIECKAPTIKISQDTFDQILTYNYMINAPYLIVTNGLFHVFCKIESKTKFSFLEKIPDYKQLI